MPVYIYMYVNIHICMCVYIHMHVYSIRIYIHMYIYIHVYTFICTYTYIYTHTEVVRMGGVRGGVGVEKDCINMEVRMRKRVFASRKRMLAQKYICDHMCLPRGTEHWRENTVDVDACCKSDRIYVIL